MVDQETTYLLKDIYKKYAICHKYTSPKMKPIAGFNPANYFKQGIAHDLHELGPGLCLTLRIQPWLIRLVPPGNFADIQFLSSACQSEITVTIRHVVYFDPNGSFLTTSDRFQFWLESTPK